MNYHIKIMKRIDNTLFSYLWGFQVEKCEYLEIFDSSQRLILSSLKMSRLVTYIVTSFLPKELYLEICPENTT